MFSEIANTFFYFYREKRSEFVSTNKKTKIANKRNLEDEYSKYVHFCLQSLHNIFHECNVEKVETKLLSKDLR